MRLHTTYRAHDNAIWEGGLYTDKVIPQEVRPEGYETTWCHDAALLSRLASDPCMSVVCVWLGGGT